MCAVTTLTFSLCACVKSAFGQLLARVCVVFHDNVIINLQDPEYKSDRGPNDNSKKFVTQAKKLNIDVCVALDKLYKDPDQTSDNIKPESKCMNEGNDSEDDSPDDTTKLKYSEKTNHDQSRTHGTCIVELSNPRLTLFEEIKAGKPERKEKKSEAQQESYFIQKFEEEHRQRMVAEAKVKELQANNKFLESILKKSRECHDKEIEKFEELDKHQKEEIAQLQQDKSQLKQELSDSQKANDQFKNSIEDLTLLGEVYQGELQDLQEKVNHTKQELDLTLAEKTQLEEHVQALEAEKEQLSSQVQSLSPTSQWKIDHDELTITANVLGTGAWGFVKEGIFHGTKVAVKGIHQAIISVADEVIQREFSIMAQVRHPNLVLLMGAVFDDPRHKGPLIITELLDCDMRSAYKEYNLDRKYRLPLLRNVATALNYLRSRKQPIIHRDVSSANVMLEASVNGKWKRAKLCDFGSAKLTSRATTPAPGAAIYSAPETLPATKGKQTTKVDVYSFGVLYCEILLARLPPDLDPTTEDFSKFISDLKRLEGTDIHQTAHICTNKHPKKRPTMKEVIQDIDCHILRYHAQ